MNEEPNEKLDSAPEGFQGLHLEAPPDTLDRFRTRAGILQGTRFVLERQFYGFWIVLNTFLKLLFKRARIPIAPPDEEQARRYRRSIQNSKEGRP